ncbi:MAG: MFS transporter [Anaerolineae bacterium]|nr:MFS transporter [Gloeobacterales cyanobacterium ES-bin-313]
MTALFKTVESGWIFFRQPSIWRLCLSRWLSDWGDATHVLAFNWLVIARTGSAGAAGLCSALWLIGQLLGSWPGGWLADRRSARSLLLSSYLLHSLVVSACAIAFWLNSPIGVLAGLSMLLGSLGALHDPAQRSYLKQLCKDDQQLARLNGLLTGGGALAQCGGPLLAGWMLTWASAALPFWCNAVSFVLAAFLIWGLPAPGRASGEAPVSVAGSVWQQLKPLRFILPGGLAFLLGPAPLLVSFLPYYVQHVRGWSAGSLGLLEASRSAGLGIGVLCGSFLIARGLPLHRTVRLTLVALIIPLVGFWLSEESTSATLASWLVVLGLLAGGAYVCLNQLFLQEVGTDWIGRVTATLSAIAGIGLFLGWLTWSWVIDHLGYPVALRSAVFVFALGLIPALIPQKYPSKN